MARAWFEKEVYVRFADEPMAFVYTVKYGGFTVKSARIPIASPDGPSAGIEEPIDDASNTVKQLVRKPTLENSDRAG